MARVGGGRVVAVGAAHTAGTRAYDVYLQDAGAGDGAEDASGAMAPHVAIEPQDATAPAEETDAREVPGRRRGPCR